MFICKFCKKDYATNSGRGVHEIQCNLNPEKRNIQQGRSAWNKGLSKESDTRVAKNALAIKASSSTIGRCKDPGKEKARRIKLSVAAKRLGFGGYKPNAGRSQKYKVVDSFGKETTLQSSFELKCSIILNELGIRWSRPKALKYDNRNYFADFYLPDHNLYLDPKNNYKANLDKEKIKKVIEQNNVRVEILLEDYITKEYIARLVQR